MILPYRGCFTFRSTFTTTVFRPCRTPPCRSICASASIVSLLRGRARTLGLLRLDAGDRAPHFLDARGLFKLAGGRLEAEVERLALQFAKLFGELVVGLGLEIFGLGHVLNPPDRSEEHTYEIQSLRRISS